jgi:CheY-like chemotaxis protein
MSPKSKPGRTVHILVVEDDIHISRLIGLAMPNLGMPYHFNSVISAAQALELWKNDPFDLLLVDYNLPGMNGLQLIADLKQQGVTIPMMLVTAYGTPALERKALELNVAAYISKPFDIVDLIDTIRILLAEHVP